MIVKRSDTIASAFWLVLIERSTEVSDWGHYSPMMAANSNTFRLRSSTFPPKSRSCRSAINKMAFSTWSEC
jgi:hypothetical protein